MDRPAVARRRGRPRKETLVKGDKSPTKDNTQSTLDYTRVKSLQNDPKPSIQINFGEVNPSDEGITINLRWTNIVRKQPETPFEHWYESGDSLEILDTKVVSCLPVQHNVITLQQPLKQAIESQVQLGNNLIWNTIR